MASRPRRSRTPRGSANPWNFSFRCTYIVTLNGVVAPVEVISVFMAKGFSSHVSRANSSPRCTNNLLGVPISTPSS